jgi:hypothetical protein
MFVFVWFFVPETKGLSLEQMDDLFGAAGGRANDEEGGLEKQARISVVQEEGK